MYRFALLLAWGSWVAGGAAGPTGLPARAPEALGGRAVAERIWSLGVEERERLMVEEVLAGNVPEFWRRFVEVPLRAEIEGVRREAVVAVAPDYLAVGRDDDYFVVPLTVGTAAQLAGRLGCVLPTRRMVDAIYAAAAVRLAPQPMAPSASMTTVPVFWAHHEAVWRQRMAVLEAHPLGALVAGHKKDVVVSAGLVDAPGKVAIYGWHRTNGVPIQPLYLGHTARWVDYSHGIRMVARRLRVDGEVGTVEGVLADPVWWGLLSDEGPVVAGAEGVGVGAVGTRAEGAGLGERQTELRLAEDVRAVVVEPGEVEVEKPVRLVLYALPNGNTIEQTMGRRKGSWDDWRYDIQHVAAQVRWLRERVRSVVWVVVYLESGGLAWPAWRRRHEEGDRRMVSFVEALRGRWAGREVQVVLTGHSGGGSFTFGYLNGVERIPDEVERIAFLDSNYAYDAARGHGRKLGEWLRRSDRHFLCVLAYHDSLALLNGKSFVSEEGGTWGRSQAMRRDLAEWMDFEEEHDSAFQRYRALGGRVVFLLKENPERAILHTRQVEWNGLIHAMVVGTPEEGRGYVYFGQRAYEMSD